VSIHLDRTNVSVQQDSLLNVVDNVKVERSIDLHLFVTTTTIDIDECRIGTANCRAEDACVNLRGAYRCYSVECPEGYERLGNKSVESAEENASTIRIDLSFQSMSTECTLVSR
jgi:hypothetical protein